MLLAFSIDAVGILTTETIDGLRALEVTLSQRTFKGMMAGLGFRWEGVEPGLVDGSFVRGYARITERDRALAMVDALRQLSREFPGVTVHVSGWGDMPATSLRGGSFELFAARWEALMDERLAPQRHRHAS